MRPDYGASFGARLPEVAHISKFAEHSEIQERSAIVKADFAIGELDFKLMFILCRNLCNSRNHLLPQWLNFERLLAADGKLPISQQLVSMYFNPSQY
jgi:hypothetical protein